MLYGLSICSLIRLPSWQTFPMPKLAKRVAVALLCIVLLALVVRFLLFGRGSEPTYNGQYLSDWAGQFERNANPQEREEAITAIHAMCSDKLAMLVTWLDYDPAPRETKLKAALGWLPSDLREKLENGLLADPDERRAEAAETALPVFGPNIVPLVPQLMNLANSTNEVIAQRALHVAAQLGTNGLAILLPIAADTNNPHQFAALLYLAFLPQRPADPGPILRILAASTQSPNSIIVRVAAAGLGWWRADPDTSPPALLPLLSHPDNRTRASAIAAVGRFGTASRSAIPLLVNCLQDPFPAARIDATNALHEIDPKQFTNTAPLPSGKF
jgi:hypothetical protein